MTKCGQTQATARLAAAITLAGACLAPATRCPADEKAPAKPSPAELSISWAFQQTRQTGLPTLVIATTPEPSSRALGASLRSLSDTHPLRRAIQIVELPIEGNAALANDLGITRAPAMVIYRREGHALKIAARRSGPADLRTALAWLQVMAVTPPTNPATPSTNPPSSGMKTPDHSPGELVANGRSAASPPAAASVDAEPRGVGDSSVVKTEAKAPAEPTATPGDPAEAVPSDGALVRTSHDLPTSQGYPSEQRYSQPPPPKAPPVYYPPPQPAPPPMYMAPAPAPVVVSPPAPPVVVQPSAPTVVVGPVPQPNIIFASAPPTVSYAPPAYSPPASAPPNLLAPPASAPPASAPPASAPPSAPPASAPPAYAPPSYAPPAYAPPSYAPPAAAPPAYAPVASAPLVPILTNPNLLDRMIGTIGEHMAEKKNPRIRMAQSPAYAPIGQAPAAAPPAAAPPAYAPAAYAPVAYAPAYAPPAASAPPAFAAYPAPPAYGPPPPDYGPYPSPSPQGGFGHAPAPPSKGGLFSHFRK